MSGKMTKLGVSLLSPGVQKAMCAAAGNFYLLDDLHAEVNAFAAKHFSAKYAEVVGSASAGIFLTAAAVLMRKQKAVPEATEAVVALPRMHFIDYGAPIADILSLARARLVGAGSVNLLKERDLAGSLAHRPDLAVFVSSHHVPDKPSVSPEKFAAFYRAKGVLTMIDIAAEEDVWRFLTMGFTFVVVSGSKAIAGPSSGIVFSAEDFRDEFLALRHGIGRVAKVSKENLLGLAAAIEEYGPRRKVSEVERDVEKWVKKISQIGVTASMVEDTKRKIRRIVISTTPQRAKGLAEFFTSRSVYFRDYAVPRGLVELDLRQTNEQQMALVVDLIKE